MDHISSYSFFICQIFILLVTTAASPPPAKPKKTVTTQKAASPSPAKPKKKTVTTPKAASPPPAKPKKKEKQPTNPQATPQKGKKLIQDQSFFYYGNNNNNFSQFISCFGKNYITSEIYSLELMQTYINCVIHALTHRR